VISKILFMCRKEKYSLVSDFAWYTSVLLELAVMPGSRHGAEVADQLIEVALRVDTVRPYAVEMMLTMLLNEELVLGHARTTVCEVLKAAAWIVGEYSDIVGHISRDRSDSLDDEDSGAGDGDTYWIEGATGEDIRSAWRGQKVHLLVMEALLHPRATSLPALVQKVYLQAALKVFVRSSDDCDVADLADIVGVVRRRLSVFMQVRSFFRMELSRQTSS
jgi:AP-3 complex subunit delta-1